LRYEQAGRALVDKAAAKRRRNRPRAQAAGPDGPAASLLEGPQAGVDKEIDGNTMRASKTHFDLCDLSSRATSFRAPVARELSLVDRELSRILPNGGGLIDEVSDHLLSSRGKKFRPTLLLLTSRMTGGAPTEESIAASVVVELVHMATLVHDDTIDKSKFRRGRPTINTRWNEQVSVIMGDYVYTKVFKILADLRMFKVMDILAKSTHDMTIGEMAQIERKHKFDTTEEEYMAVIGNKTASLIAAACEIGAAVAGADDRGADICSSFGSKIGLAFQIMDDILDFIGDEFVLGKPRGSDVKGGDMTLPLIGALRGASEPDREILVRLLSSVSSERGALDRLTDMIERRGGFAYAKDRAAQCAKEAKDLLLTFGPSPSRDALLLAADYVVDRNY
jgi:octaprenyl-diphosphate synthase